MKPKVSIIIANWNGRDILERCLFSLFSKTTYPNYEVILVDNGSKDGSLDRVNASYPQVKLIELDKNYGFSVATNKGIRASSGEYILFLNNDTEIIQGDWIGDLVTTAELDTSIGAVGCRQVLSDGSYYPDLDKITNVGEGLTGNAALIKRYVFKDIGLLDEGYSPFLYEDTDFFRRAKKKGYQIIHNPHIEVLHNHSTSIKKNKRYYVTYVYFKNRIRYILKGLI